METRAHHLLIGAFMVLMIGGFLGFLIWLAKIDIDQEFVEYDIFFEYNGIPVGQVQNIRIDPSNPNRVLVEVKIESDINIYEDSVAVLAMQGITGVAYVQIEGGSVGAAFLTSDDEEKHPEIMSRISPIQELFVGAPDFINQAIGVVGKINDLLNEENRTSVGNILRNVDDVSENFAVGTKDIEQLVADLNKAILNVSNVAEKLDGGSAGAIGSDGGVLASASGIVGVLAGANELLANLNRLLDDQGAVTAFANGTLPELSRLVIEARRLAIVLSSLAESIENEPSGLIFTPSKPEYSPNH